MLCTGIVTFQVRPKMTRRRLRDGFQQESAGHCSVRRAKGAAGGSPRLCHSLRAESRACKHAEQHTLPFAKFASLSALQSYTKYICLGPA